jgi:hypothetical protein
MEPHTFLLFSQSTKNVHLYNKNFFLTRVYTTPPLLNFPLKDEPIEIKIILFGG